MTSTTGPPLTPRRKRGASGTADDWNNACALTRGFLKRPNTPEVNDLPELDRDDTPGPRDEGPTTPSPFASPPRTHGIVKESPVGSTPRRRLKASKISHPFLVDGYASPAQQEPKIYYASQSGHIDLRPAPLFQYLYPQLPSVKTEGSKTLRKEQDICSSKDFNFSQWTRQSEQGLASNTPRFYGLAEERGAVQKRLKKKASMHNGSVQYATEIPQVPSFVPNQSKAANQPVLSRRHNTATGKRFSRILPLDAVERVIQGPTQCVASLVGKPGQRCSFSVRSYNDAKNKILNRLSEVDDATDLISIKSYLKDFINTMTCQDYHYPIATEQLERLYNQYLGNRNKVRNKNFDFDVTDMDALDSWLQAWTTLPEGSSSLSVHPHNQLEAAVTDTAALGRAVVPPASQKVLHFPALSPAFLEALQGIKVKQTTTEPETTYPKKPSEISKLPDQTAKKPTLPDGKAAEVIIAVQEIDISDDEDSNIQMQTPHTHGMAQVYVSEGENLKQNGNSAVTALGELSERSELKVKAEAQTSQLSKTPAVDRTIQHKQTLSTFDPKQFSGFRFVNLALEKSFTKQNTRVQQRPPKPQINFQQNFCWFHNSLDRSVQDCIYNLLHKPLTSREFDGGLIYMYWITGSFGFVKIGKTSGKSTANRLDQWREKCGHKIEEHTSGEEGRAKQLPHVYRIEALVHEELREVRLREDRCKKCGVRHQEWFGVSPEHAQKVIQKWSDFMETNPYDRYGRLKESITRERINALCQPIGDVPSWAAAPSSAPKRPTQKRVSDVRERGEGTVWSGRLRTRNMIRA